MLQEKSIKNVVPAIEEREVLPPSVRLVVGDALDVDRAVDRAVRFVCSEVSLVVRGVDFEAAVRDVFDLSVRLPVSLASAISG